LGVLEDHLPPGVVEELVARHQVAGQRLRGLSAGMAARCVLAMTVLPGACGREGMATVAGQVAVGAGPRAWRGGGWSGGAGGGAAASGRGVVPGVVVAGRRGGRGRG